jgi:hypothetical protein
MGTQKAIHVVASASATGSCGRLSRVLRNRSETMDRARQLCIACHTSGATTKISPITNHAQRSSCSSFGFLSDLEFMLGKP